MLSTFFANICILVTFVYLAGLLSKKFEVHITSAAYYVRIAGGALFGICGIVLMNYSIPVGAGTLADLRHLGIVASAAYLGPWAAIISAVIMSPFRVILFGWSDSSVTGSIVVLSTGLACALLSLLPWRRLTQIFAMNLAASAILFSGLLRNLKDLGDVMSFFPLQLSITLAGGVLLYLIAESVNSTNEILFRLEHNAITDYLTNLYNRRLLESSLQEELQRASKQGKHLSVLALDLDHFKEVNDTYGHAAGDVVLRNLGQILLRQCRSFDIVSRSGGEEFTMLLPDCTHGQAMIIAEDIRRAVERHRFR